MKFRVFLKGVRLSSELVDDDYEMRGDGVAYFSIISNFLRKILENLKLKWKRAELDLKTF